MVVSVSSTLVNVAEDAELRLVSLLADAAVAPVASNFALACESCVSAGDAAKLLHTIVNDKNAISALMVIETTEAVSALSLLAALLDRVKAGEAQLATAVADAVLNAEGAASGEEQAAVDRKITLLSVLYNMRSDSKEKCSLLRRMILLAGKFADTFLNEDSTLGMLLSEENASLVIPTKPRLVALLESWNVPDNDRRDLYQQVASVITVTDKRKQRFLLLLLQSYKTQIDAPAMQAAKDAAVGAIRDPVSLFVHQRSMLALPAIQALAKDSKTALLSGLLKVFLEGKLSDYQDFCAANGGEAAVLSPWGLDAAHCQRHMKILSLCTLGSEHEEIPYAVIAETLQLPETIQVETWVIAAVGSGLLQAKMDQLAQKVMVERCVVRRFDMDQWKALKSRLELWKTNVGSVLATLKQSQAGSATVSSN
jgi:translation initiation factor 3 subunit M